MGKSTTIKNMKASLVVTIENMKAALIDSAEFRAEIENMLDLKSLAERLYNAGWRCVDFSEMCGNAAIICAMLDEIDEKKREIE